MDLITVAMALHWINREPFHLEAKRVLKPGSVLAAFGHNYPKLRIDDEQANHILMNEVSHNSGGFTFF